MKTILPLILLVLAVSVDSESFAQQAGDQRAGTPTASPTPVPDFFLSSTIGFRLKLPDAPVKIVGLGDGPAAAMQSVKIENASGKQVRAIKLSWYLFNDPTSTTVVKKGQTKKIKLDGFGAGQIKTVESKIRLDELFKGLARDGYITGAWFLEATVGEVEYSDGTKWTKQQP